jgi:hypothetical protein
LSPALPRGLLLLALSAALLAFHVPSASAQTEAPGAGEFIGITFLPTTVEGRLAVDFSANPGTGCAAPCDLQGRVVWTPAREAMVTILETRVRGRTEFEVSLDFEDSGGERPATAAEVTRAASSGSPGHCQDARVDRFGSLDFTGDTPGTAIARLAAPQKTVSFGADLLSTRCAGPLESDIAAVLPTRTLPVDALRRGATTLDLSANRPFAAGGMAGTVRSSIVLRVERPEPPEEGSFELPREILRALKFNRLRIVDAIYDVERLSGDLTTTFDGSTQPELCGPVDSCGLRGSVKVTHAVTEGEAILSAIGPARLTRRQLGAALGLNGGRPSGAIATSGIVTWEEDPGRVASTVTDPGGRACADTAGLGSGMIDLTFSRSRISAGYGLTGLFDGDPLRSRCAGPGFTDASDGSNPVARGSVPRRALRKRRLTIPLNGGSVFSSGSYSGKVQAGLTLTMRRVRVEHSTLRVPSFGGGFGR